MTLTRSQKIASAQSTPTSPISSCSVSRSSPSKSKSKSKGKASSSKALDVIGGISKLLRRGKRVFSGYEDGESASSDSNDYGSHISDASPSNARNGNGDAPEPTTANANTSTHTKNSYTSSFASAADCDEVDKIILAKAAVHATSGTVTATAFKSMSLKINGSDATIKVELSRATIPLPIRPRPRLDWPMIVTDTSANAEDEDEDDARLHSSVGTANAIHANAHTIRAEDHEDNDVRVSSRLKSTKGAMYTGIGLSQGNNNNSPSEDGGTPTEDGLVSSKSTNGPMIQLFNNFSAVRTPVKMKNEFLTVGDVPSLRDVPAPGCDLTSESPSGSSTPNRILSSTRLTSRSCRSKSPNPDSPYRSTSETCEERERVFTPPTKDELDKEKERRPMDAQMEQPLIYGRVFSAPPKDKEETHHAIPRARTPFPHCPKSSSLRESLAPSPEIFTNRTGTDSEAVNWTYTAQPIWPERRRWLVEDRHGNGKESLSADAGSRSEETNETNEEGESKTAKWNEKFDGRGKKRARDEDEVEEASEGGKVTSLEGPRGKRTRYAASPGPSSTSPSSPHTTTHLPSPTPSPSSISRSPTPPLDKWHTTHPFRREWERHTRSIHGVLSFRKTGVHRRRGVLGTLHGSSSVGLRRMSSHSFFTVCYCFVCRGLRIICLHSLSCLLLCLVYLLISRSRPISFVNLFHRMRHCPSSTLPNMEEVFKLLDNSGAIDCEAG